VDRPLLTVNLKLWSARTSVEAICQNHFYLLTLVHLSEPPWQSRLKFNYIITARHVVINLAITALAIVVAAVFWGTNLFNRILLEVSTNSFVDEVKRMLTSLQSNQNVVLKNGSDMLSWYVSPPIDAIVKVYVFNYTNMESYAKGIDKRIKLQELGPYTYRERADKIQLNYRDDKITFNVSKANKLER